jgi:hypothetical protein
MNLMLAIDSASETSAITSPVPKPEESAISASSLTRTRSSRWHAAEMLEGVAAIFVTFYVVAAVALCVGLLFYTFTR